MRLGYSYWGFLGDNKIENGQHVSTPDGNATYSWSIIWEALRRGWDVFSMQEDRDIGAWSEYGPANFSAFSQGKRMHSYLRTQATGGVMFPELDVLLIEWRFPIFGRNCHSWEGVPCFPEPWNNGASSSGQLQPDYWRQYQLLRHYSGTKTKIIFWDLDHKLDLDSETYWAPSTVFETSVEPVDGFAHRTRVEPPIVTEDLLQFPTLKANPKKALAYIGSRYERDDVITEWIKPVSEVHDVCFYGNWMKTVEECRKLWPMVKYHDRITTKDFREVYGDAVACPLLAKRSYLKSGFITPRVWEALMFGTLPIGLGEANGISQYVLPSLVAKNGLDMIEIVELLNGISQRERDQLRRENVEMLEFMDVRHFVDRIEDVLNGTAAVAQATEEKGA